MEFGTGADFAAAAAGSNRRKLPAPRPQLGALADRGLAGGSCGAQRVPFAGANGGSFGSARDRGVLPLQGWICGLLPACASKPGISIEKHYISFPISIRVYSAGANTYIRFFQLRRRWYSPRRTILTGPYSPASRCCPRPVPWSAPNDLELAKTGRTVCAMEPSEPGSQTSLPQKRRPVVSRGLGRSGFPKHYCRNWSGRRQSRWSFHSATNVACRPSTCRL